MDTYWNLVLLCRQLKKLLELKFIGVLHLMVYGLAIRLSPLPNPHISRICLYVINFPLGSQPEQIVVITFQLMFTGFKINPYIPKNTLSFGNPALIHEFSVYKMTDVEIRWRRAGKRLVVL